MISSYKFSVQEEKKKTLAIYISIYSTVVQKLIYESLSLQNYNTRALKELTDLRAVYIHIDIYIVPPLKLFVFYSFQM